MSMQVRPSGDDCSSRLSCWLLPVASANPTCPSIDHQVKSSLAWCKVRDQARRFITLLDELYNCRTRLVCSAEVPPDDLFSMTPDEQPLLDLESLQFETAVEGGPGAGVHAVCGPMHSFILLVKAAQEQGWLEPLLASLQAPRLSSVQGAGSGET